MRDAWLLARIQAVYAASEGIYGSPRIQRALQEAAIAVSRKRVARLMREAGLRARAVAGASSVGASGPTRPAA